MKVLWKEYKKSKFRILSLSTNFLGTNDVQVYYIDAFA